MQMTRDELRAFCEMENFALFQEKLNRASEADSLDVLSYLIAEGMEKPVEKTFPPLQANRPGRAR